MVRNWARTLGSDNEIPFGRSFEPWPNFFLDSVIVRRLGSENVLAPEFHFHVHRLVRLLLSVYIADCAVVSRLISRFSQA